jgi:hypothetical protein
MAVARSRDGGRTWTATYFAEQTGVAQFNDKPFITVDTNRKSKFFGRIYVAWDHATGTSSSEKNGNNVVLSYSDDGGVTFSDPTSVSGDFTGRTGGIGADPYVTRDGTLHVAWQDYAHMTIAEASSTDGGATFSSPHVIALVGGFDFSLPAQAVRGALVYPSCDSFGTALYCSFMNGTDLAAQVYLSRSTDGGRTWSAPIKVNASPAGVAAFTPSVDVASDGTVAVTYYDFRNNTPSTSTLPTDAFAVFSHDGGSTFGGEVRLTPTSFDLDLAPRAGGLFLGDYVGLSHAGATFVPFYTQTVSSANPTDIFASFVP